MAVNLQKGQRASLDSSMKMALIGLGWDPNKYDGGYDFDLDASAFICGANGKVLSDNHFVFYGNQDFGNHTVWSSGDDQTGGNSADGDDEQIFIDFSKIPPEVDKIAITVTIYDAVNRRQNFGQVSNAYVRVAKIQNEFDTVGETVIQFDLEEEFSIETALVVCEIYRKTANGNSMLSLLVTRADWKLSAATTASMSNKRNQFMP